MPQAVLAAPLMEIPNSHAVSMPVHDESIRIMDAGYSNCSKRPRTVMDDVTKDVNIERSLSHQQASSRPHNVKQIAQSASANVDGQQASKRKVSGPLPVSATAQKAAEEEDDRREHLSLSLLAEVSYLLTRPAVTQKQINSAMRALLVDWLVEVCQEFKCSVETLHLGVAILDRYIHVRVVSIDTFQLLGITCLWIAMKYEELQPRNGYDCIDMTNSSYALADILDMEAQVLDTISFRLTQPTAPQFLDIFALNSGLQDKHVIAMAYYLVELVLLHGLGVQYRPSELAAAALYVATSTVHADPVPRRLLRATPYNLEHLTPAIRALSQLHKSSCDPLCTTSVKVKYTQESFYRVAASYGYQPFPIRMSRSSIVTKKGNVVIAAARAN